MRFRHDDMCERAAPDDGCGCRHRLLSSESIPADDAGDTVRVIVQQRDEARAAADRLRAEVERLRKWKAEALPVMSGLQEVGNALGVPLGQQITARATVDAALDLRNQRDNLRVTLGAVREVLDEWGTVSGPAAELYLEIRAILAANPVSLADVPMVRQARRWIETCVDPVAVGQMRKQAMLDYLDGKRDVPDFEQIEGADHD